MLINFNGFHFFCQDMFDKKKKENSLINVVIVFRPNILLITFQVSRTLPLFSEMPFLKYLDFTALIVLQFLNLANLACYSF